MSTTSITGPVIRFAAPVGNFTAMRTIANQIPLGKARESSLLDLVAHQTHEIQTLSDTIAHLELRLRSGKVASREEAVSDRLGLIEEALGIDRHAIPTIRL